MCYAFRSLCSLLSSKDNFYFSERQSKTFPPCVKLVDLWCLTHDCSCLYPLLWLPPLSSPLPHLSLHSFFFTSSLTSHQPPHSLPIPSPEHPLQRLWVFTIVKKRYSIHLWIHLSSSHVLFPLFLEKQLHTLLRFLPHSILSRAAQRRLKHATSTSVQTNIHGLAEIGLINSSFCFGSNYYWCDRLVNFNLKVKYILLVKIKLDKIMFSILWKVQM